MKIRKLWKQHRAGVLAAAAGGITAMSLLFGWILPNRRAAAESLSEAESIQREVTGLLTEGEYHGEEGLRKARAEAAVLRESYRRIRGELELPLEPAFRPDAKVDPLIQFNSSAERVGTTLTRAAAETNTIVPKSWGFSGVQTADPARALRQLAILERMGRAVIDARVTEIVEVLPSPPPAKAGRGEQGPKGPPSPVQDTVTVKVRGTAGTIAAAVALLQRHGRFLAVNGFTLELRDPAGGLAEAQISAGLVVLPAEPVAAVVADGEAGDSSGAGSGGEEPARSWQRR